MDSMIRRLFSKTTLLTIRCRGDPMMALACNASAHLACACPYTFSFFLFEPAPRSAFEQDTFENSVPMLVGYRKSDDFGKDGRTARPIMITINKILWFAVLLSISPRGHCVLRACTLFNPRMQVVTIRLFQNIHEEQN